MTKIEQNTQILITKNRPEPEGPETHFPVIEKIGLENNFLIRSEEHSLFHRVLDDFGINPIVYYNDEEERT